MDLGGRRISLSGPIDMNAAVNNRTSFETRRAIRNGQLQPISGPAWEDDVVVAQATYNAASSVWLSNVANIAAIQVGSLVTGNGVGREVYVRSVDIAASQITLSQQLFDAEGTQKFTFMIFKYHMYFSVLDNMTDLVLDQIELRCDGVCSAILLAPQGLLFQIHDYQFIRSKDRGVSSPGDGCQGMVIDRCNFESAESSIPTQLRKSLCYNSNANDVKTRNNRAARFRHFGVMNGGQSIIVNNFIGWTDEHDATPDVSGYSFGGLSITGNVFLAIDVQASFRRIVIKPYGVGNYINGLNVQGNIFRMFSGNIERFEMIDTTYAYLDQSWMRNIIFEGNAFNGVNNPTRNPHIDVHVQSSPDQTWTMNTQNYLPFDGPARMIDALVPIYAVRNSAGDAVFANPYVSPSQGADDDEFLVNWPEPVKGQVRFSVLVDNPA